MCTRHTHNDSVSGGLSFKQVIILSMNIVRKPAFLNLGFCGVTQLLFTPVYTIVIINNTDCVQ